MLKETAEDLGNAGWDQWYGYGLVNAAEAAGIAPEPSLLTSIQVSPVDVLLFVGENKQFFATGADQYGAPITTGTIFWESSNPAVGTINQEGIFIADDAGETTIKATGEGGVFGTASVIVIEIPTLSEIGVSPDSVTLHVGEEKQFAVTGRDQYGGIIETGPITWTSTDETVAIVNENGLVKAVGLGDAAITTTGDGNVVGTAIVTVQDEPVGPDEFSFTGYIAPSREFRHTISVSGPAVMHVSLTWRGWGDLRLRIYNPDGTMVAEADSSTWGNQEEEITIDVIPGDWQIAVQSDIRQWSMNYLIEGTLSYQIHTTNGSKRPFIDNRIWPS